VEADGLEGRLFQHELDHLHGVLMFDRMSPEQRKDALAEYERILTAGTTAAPKRRLRLR
jgi:peptide deformylase